MRNRDVTLQPFKHERDMKIISKYLLLLLFNLHQFIFIKSRIIGKHLKLDHSEQCSTEIFPVIVPTYSET